MSDEVGGEIDKKAKERKKAILESVTDITCNGCSYYVSPNGNDNFDGKSPEKAWKTLKKVSEYSFNSGDVVYLERSALFRERVLLKSDGLTLSAYGEGEKPKIYGSYKNYNSYEDWIKTEYENLYLCSSEFECDVGNIVFNHGEQYGLRQLIGNFGFNGDLTELDQDMQFFYDKSSGKLYLNSISHPAERFFDIEICEEGHIISVMADNITIDNLCLKYGGSHGIGGTNRKGISVQNCEIGWIGGCVLFVNSEGKSVRFGNGVEIYAKCFGFVVRNNYIYQIYDAAVTHQYFQDAKKDIFIENIYYGHNLIENCTYSIEYALAKQSNSNQHMKNVLIENNILRFAGYGFGKQRPDKNTPAHIKSWEICNESENFVIRNNVFDRSRYMLLHIAAYKEEWLPKLYKNKYIQNCEGQLGRYGVVPTELCYTNATNFLNFEHRADITII